MSRNFELRSTTAEAMIAQLCHDIAAPVSGVVTSSNLMLSEKTNKDTFEVAKELLSSSVNELLERLSYIREMCTLDHELEFIDISITNNSCSKLLSLKGISFKIEHKNIVEEKIDSDFNKLLLWLIWFIYRSSIGSVDVKVKISLSNDIYLLEIDAAGENFVFNEQKIKIMLNQSKDKMSHYNAEAIYIKDLLKDASDVSIKESKEKGLKLKLSYQGRVYKHQ